MRTRRKVEFTMDWLKSQSVVDANGCWLWNKVRSPKGYGVVKAPFCTTQRVHRIAWMMVNGEIPPGMLVCHRCDVPACFNPDHLFLGTARTNRSDAISKGRIDNLVRSGVRHPCAKLTDEAVRTIRSSALNDYQLARLFKVDRITVRRARLGLNWKHVDSPCLPPRQT